MCNFRHVPILHVPILHVIEEDVCLDHVIFDKEVHVTKGRRLIGQDSYPLAIEKGGII